MRFLSDCTSQTAPKSFQLCTKSLIAAAPCKMAAALRQMGTKHSLQMNAARRNSSCSTPCLYCVEDVVWTRGNHRDLADSRVEQQHKCGSHRAFIHDMLEPAKGSSWHGSKLAYSQNVPVRRIRRPNPNLVFGVYKAGV